MLRRFQESFIFVKASFSQYFSATISTLQLCLGAAISSEQLRFCRTTSYRRWNYVVCLQRAVTFWSSCFLAEELFRIKICTEELLCRSKYFCTASTFAEELQSAKIEFFIEAMFRITHSFWRATFLERMLF